MVQSKSRILVVFEGWCGFARVGVAIPPVVARIFSGDSTSPLTREARVLAWGKGWCGDLSVVDFCTATEKIGYCAVPD